MKKLLVALAVIVGLGGTATAQNKVAHVNTQALLDTMPSRDAAEQQLMDYQQTLMTELQEMEKDLVDAEAELKRTMGDLTPTMKAYKQKALNEKYQRFQQRQQSADQELVDISNELNAPILARVKEAIKIVSDRKKLAYVMDVTNTLYSAGGIDITDEVIVELLKLEKAAL